MADDAQITTAVRHQLSMLTADQVCELLQVSKVWLYREVRAGKFPHRRVGRLLRFKASEVDDYLAGEGQMVEPEPPQSLPRRRGRPRKT